MFFKLWEGNYESNFLEFFWKETVNLKVILVLANVVSTMMSTITTAVFKVKKPILIPFNDRHKYKQYRSSYWEFLVPYRSPYLFSKTSAYPHLQTAYLSPPSAPSPSITNHLPLPPTYPYTYTIRTPPLCPNYQPPSPNQPRAVSTPNKHPTATWLSYAYPLGTYPRSEGINFRHKH